MTSKEKQNTKAETKKFIEEANFDTDERARNIKDYEAMLMDFIRSEFEV